MESPDAYTTPVLFEHDGKAQILISGGDYVTGHDPQTGREIWRAGGLNPQKRPNYRIVGTPVAAEGIIFAPTRKKPLLALRTGGEGDVTTSHLVWTYEGSAGPDVPSPVQDGTYFYMVDDRGLVTCLDAKTGTLIWGPEETTEGIVSASPILSEDRMYILNEKAVTTVAGVGKEFKVLAINELDGTYTLASPAVSGSQMFIRTSTHLYCIGSSTGDLIWECDGMTMNAIPSPVSTKGLIFVMSGFRGNALLAIRLAEAKGNITGSGAIVWRHDLEDSFHATPVIVGKDLYLRGFDHLYCIAED